MSKLRSALKEYLALRRALGYKLYRAGLLLHQFVQFAERAGATCITTDLALQWATQPGKARKTWWATRLGVVRQFAQYCSGRDLRTVVPPPDLLPASYRRVPPYLYKDEQIKPCSRRQSTFRLEWASGPIPTQRSSGCTSPRGCAPARRCVSIAATWTLRRVC